MHHKPQGPSYFHFPKRCPPNWASEWLLSNHWVWSDWAWVYHQPCGEAWSCTWHRQRPRCQMVTCNVHRKEWTCITIHTSFFTVSQRSSELRQNCVAMWNTCHERHTKVKKSANWDRYSYDGKRVQHDINRCTVWKVRHIFNRVNTGYNFVSVTTSHLILRDAIFRLWCKHELTWLSTYLHHLRLRGCDFNIANDSISTRYTKRCILHFTRFHLQRSREGDACKTRLFVPALPLPTRISPSLTSAPNTDNTCLSKSRSYLIFPNV